MKLNKFHLDKREPAQWRKLIFISMVSHIDSIFYTEVKSNSVFWSSETDTINNETFIKLTLALTSRKREWKALLRDP